MSLLELFCNVDDFLLQFEPHWKAYQVQTGKQRERAGQLSPSEVMTILIHSHQSHYRTFESYYTEYLKKHLLPNMSGYR
jgi:hypothetical protein